MVCIDYVLLVLLFLAVFYDFKSYIVPNKLILAGYMCGMLKLCMEHGMAGGVVRFVVLLMVVWLVFLPVYALKGLGGGDCKLLAVIPLFIDGTQVMECYLLIFACAAMVGCIKLVLLKNRSFRFTLPMFTGVLWHFIRNWRGGAG